MKYYNKVVFGGQTIIDLTQDTVTADSILSGYTAHDKQGKEITGEAKLEVSYDQNILTINAPTTVNNNTLNL